MRSFLILLTLLIFSLNASVLSPLKNSGFLGADMSLNLEDLAESTSNGSEEKKEDKKSEVEEVEKEFFSSEHRLNIHSSFQLYTHLSELKVFISSYISLIFIPPIA